MKRFLPVAAMASLFLTSNAHADRLGPDGNSVGAITEIGKGVKELSLETQLVYSSVTNKGVSGAPDTNNSSIALMGAGVFRYFIIDNLNLGLHLGGFFRKSSSKVGDEERFNASDAGFIGSVTASYLASVGGGMFVAPMLGGGFFAGSREARSPATTVGQPDVVLRYSISGPVVRAGLGLVFYASRRFNLFARPEAVIYIGSSKQKEEQLPAGVTASESTKFTTIEGGFTCGLSYVF